MSDFSVNDFLTERSGNCDYNLFKYGPVSWNRRFWRFPGFKGCVFHAKFSRVGLAPSAGHLRYTAALVPIDDFEGKT
ncbi:hypothetical protein [Pseudomonas sp. SDO5271_S396]